MRHPDFETAHTARAALLAAGLLFTLALPATCPADEATGSTADPGLTITEVLATDVFLLPLPVFHDAERAGVEAADLLDTLPPVPGGQDPCHDCVVAAPGGDERWRTIKSGDGVFEFSRPDEGSAAAYLAFYVTSDRWQQAELKIVTGRDLRGLFGGKELTFADKADDEQAYKTAELTLPVGKHLVVLRTAWVPAESAEDGTAGNTETADADWSLGLSLVAGEQTEDGSLGLAISPQRPVDIQLVLDAPRISGLELSPDGQYVALSLREYRDGEHAESWLEVRDTKDGDLLHVWRGGGPGSAVWCPKGHRLTWRVSEHDRSTLWYFDLDSGETGVLLADVADMGSWRWSPDGDSIVYSVRVEAEKDDRRVKRVEHPADRQPWWRDRSYLMQVFVPSGLTRRLTAGPVSVDSWRISADGKRMLFFMSEPLLEQRPYFTSELYLMDLQTLQAEKILDDRWINTAVFGPDDNVICLRGSPSAFSGLGRNLPDGMQANDYGGQLYLYDMEKAVAEPITMDFRPDVGTVVWSLGDGRIYARTTDTRYGHLHRYDPGRKTWEQVETGLEYVQRFRLPRKGSTAVVHGTSAATPDRLFVIDLKKNRARLLHDPGQAAYANSVFGEVATWACDLPDGQQLDGSIYYPPDFDPDQTYPLIVYYYGGTSPVTRDFGGRYPKNIWAGQGYVVYVPNPSGATGYGQEFAARHVNDWGKLTAGEVIEATRIFLETFDFADPEAVGCIGASYGGFLTEYIITQTDLFAAAVSHAGISSISSYWGEGLWGYAYGARALAGAFPWQDRELYIEQSALFHADKITTPLLLVHGDSDVNVPVGESDQLFTALKMLGREVEYVQIQEQDHHILDHEQRIVWNDTILAFFAKYLKGRPAWWEALYPQPKTWR